MNESVTALEHTISPVQLIYDDSKELDQLCLLPGFEKSTHPSSFFFIVIFY